MSHIDDTAEIITDPTAIDCGCSGGCGRMPDEMVITGTAGCAPLCIHCYTRAVREDERRRATKAGPSAPTDAPALTALLPVLPDAIAHYRSPAGTKGAHLARACELLLGERARHLTMIGRLTAELDLERGVDSLSDEAALRARVAELEAERADLADFLASRSEELGDCDPGGADSPIDAAKLAIEAMLFERATLASPPPGTVAALLLKVEEAERDATDCGAAPGSTEEARSVYMGQASGLREAARLITATLGAPTPLAGALDDDPAVVPMLRQRIRDLEAQVGKIGDALVSARAREASPLDRAVAEVCAVDVSGIVDAEPGTYFMTIADLANGEGQMSDRDRNMMIAAIAIRSVLACDASATKEPG